MAEEVPEGHLRTFSRSRTRLRRAVVLKRSRDLARNDLLFASFPKSGSTWMRFVLTGALTAEEIDFDRVPELSPPLGQQTGAPAIVPGGGRLVKSHEHPIFWPGDAHKPKVFLLVRDVRDVVSSYYFHWMRTGRSDGNFDAYFASFLDGTAAPFGSWQEHSRAWLRYAAEHPGQLAVVRYEDLLDDAVQHVLDASQKLQLGLARTSVERAVAESTPDSMRAKESSSTRLRSTSTNQGISFVRSAKAGQWQDKLTEAQVHEIERVAGAELHAFGYPLTTTADPAGPSSVD